MAGLSVMSVFHKVAFVERNSLRNPGSRVCRWDVILEGDDFMKQEQLHPPTIHYVWNAQHKDVMGNGTIDNWGRHYMNYICHAVAMQH